MWVTYNWIVVCGALLAVFVAYGIGKWRPPASDHTRVDIYGLRRTLRPGLLSECDVTNPQKPPHPDTP